jgi:hypothetical protein
MSVAVAAGVMIVVELLPCLTWNADARSEGRLLSRQLAQVGTVPTSQAAFCRSSSPPRRRPGPRSGLTRTLVPVPATSRRETGCPFGSGASLCPGHTDAGVLPSARASAWLGSARDAWSMAHAALTRPMWLKAWGKFPRSSPVSASTSSASSPRSVT